MSNVKLYFLSRVHFIFDTWIATQRSSNTVLSDTQQAIFDLDSLFPTNAVVIIDLSFTNYLTYHLTK